MATWTAAADAVKSVIQGTVDAADGTLSRRYFFEKKLPELVAGSGPLVTVFARADDVTPGRAIWEHTPEVRILVEQYAADDDDADDAADFVESLVSALAADTVLLEAAKLGLLSIKVDPVYAPGMLRESKIFQSVLVVTLKTGMRYGG